MLAYSQHHGPDPAQPLVLEGLLVTLASPSPSPSPAWGKGGGRCMATGPRGARVMAWVSQGRGSLPPPSPAACTHPAPSSLPPPPPPSRSCLAPSLPHCPAPRCQHSAPHTMSLRLQLKPLSAGVGGRGKGHPAGLPQGALSTATRRDSRGHPGHPRVPPGALPVPEVQRGTRLQLLPALCWFGCSFGGCFSSLFCLKSLGLWFSINSCLENNGA